MHDEPMDEVLDILHTKRELGPDAPRGLVKTLRNISTFLSKLAVSCFPILGICIAYLAHSRRPLPAIAELGQIVALCQMLAALIWLTLDIISVALDLTNLGARTFERRKSELKYDFGAASDLLAYELDTLQAVDKWLSLKIERMKMRLGLFLGGSDKVAIFALVSTGWSIWHNLPDSTWAWEKRIYLYAIGMLSGMAVGGVMMNWLIKKLTYQRDLLALAIQHKTRNTL